MNRTSLISSIALVGLMTTFSTPLKAASPLIAQASTQDINDTLSISYSGNPTTGGGYNGNWMCLNNPNSQCTR